MTTNLENKKFTKIQSSCKELSCTKRTCQIRAKNIHKVTLVESPERKISVKKIEIELFLWKFEKKINTQFVKEQNSIKLFSLYEYKNCTELFLYEFRFLFLHWFKILRIMLKFVFVNISIHFILDKICITMPIKCAPFMIQAALVVSGVACVSRKSRLQI